MKLVFLTRLADGHLEPGHPLVTITAEVVHGWVLAMQSWPQWRRISMAFERQQSAAASLTLSCPGLSAPSLSDAAGQYRPLSGLQLASEPIRNRTCHRGTEPWPDTTHIQQRPPSLYYWASKGAIRGQGQRPGWPMISRHVWTRPHTMRGPRHLIRIWRRWKRARGLPTVAGSCLCVYMYVVGMATWSVTVRPPDLPWTLPQMCSPCPRSLCWGPGGRNYTRDDPVLLGLPAFQVGLSFVGWVWS